MFDNKLKLEPNNKTIIVYKSFEKEITISYNLFSSMSLIPFFKNNTFKL